MTTEIIPCENPLAIPRALAILKEGGLVAFPTDTVYGVASLPWDKRAVERLFFAKERDARKAIPILVGNVEQLAQVTAGMTASARRLADTFWPGALTLVVPRHPNLPGAISPTPTIGVRMPDHPFALALLRHSGPLATTSANLSGGANTQTAGDVLAQLCGRIELLLDGGTTPGGVPSTVVDCTSSQPAILRQGALSADRLLAALS